MRKYILLWLFIFFAYVKGRAHIIGVDSLKVFRLNDTMYCLGVYGVHIPCPATIMDTTKEITSDSIYVSICYNDGGSQGTFCAPMDTLFLGNIGSTNFTVSVAISAGYSFPFKCVNNNWRDTFQFASIPTGVADLNDDAMAILLYPNPTENVLNVRLPHHQSGFRTRVMSIDGNVIMEKSGSGGEIVEIDISQLASGFYFLELSEEKNRWVKKWVKE